MDSVCRVWAVSEFVAEACVKDPDLIVELFESSDIRRSYQSGEYERNLEDLLARVVSEDDLLKCLRLFKRREIVRIIWRDLVKWSNLEETVGDLSALADACIKHALALLYSWQCKEIAIPRGSTGQPLKLFVVAVGKLGANELNLSSDIDLIFAYPDSTSSNEEFFIKLGQRLIRVLNATTSEGYVFRVDMRLRPRGDSGPLAISFPALKTYYQEQGRDWERYALVRARLINDSGKTGKELMVLLRNFVYRRYADYGVLEALRYIKKLINREAQVKDLRSDIKRGSGGIREIEFICQSHQLINGGKDKRLQEGSLIKVFPELVETKCLAKEVVKELKDAYFFFRHIEHCLQAVADRQTHRLPTDEYDQARLAYAMNFPSWKALEVQLSQHIEKVHKHFEKLEVVPQDKHVHKKYLQAHTDLTAVWLDKKNEQASINILARSGYDDAEVALQLIASLRKSKDYQTLDNRRQTRVDNLIPILLTVMSTEEMPDVTLRRTFSVIESIMTQRSNPDL